MGVNTGKQERKPASELDRPTPMSRGRFLAILGAAAVTAVLPSSLLGKEPEPKQVADSGAVERGLGGKTARIAGTITLAEVLDMVYDGHGQLKGEANEYGDSFMSNLRITTKRGLFRGAAASCKYSGCFSDTPDRYATLAFIGPSTAPKERPFDVIEYKDFVEEVEALHQAVRGGLTKPIIGLKEMDNGDIRFVIVNGAPVNGAKVFVGSFDSESPPSVRTITIE